MFYYKLDYYFYILYYIFFYLLKNDPSAEFSGPPKGHIPPLSRETQHLYLRRIIFCSSFILSLSFMSNTGSWSPDWTGGSFICMSNILDRRQKQVPKNCAGLGGIRR